MGRVYSLLQSYLEPIPSAWGTRVGIIAHAIMLYGFSSDLMWHEIYPLRETYFIPPHILIYCGITLLLSAFAFLKLKRYRVSLWVFVAYPLLSLFDEFWHRTYGIELASSPLAFWSPAHWSVTLVTWYMLFLLYRIGAETEPVINLFLRAVVFFVLPVRLLMYLAIPIAPYSYLESMHSPLNHLVTVAVILFMCTLHHLFRQNDMLLVGVLSLATVSGPYISLFMPQSQEFSHTTLVRVLMVTLMITLMAFTRSRAFYILCAVVTGLSLLIVPLLDGVVFGLMMYIYIAVTAGFFGSLYYDTEKYILSIVPAHALGRLREWTGATNG